MSSKKGEGFIKGFIKGIYKRTMRNKIPFTIFACISLIYYIHFVSKFEDYKSPIQDVDSSIIPANITKVSERSSIYFYGR